MRLLRSLWLLALCWIAWGRVRWLQWQIARM
jgi:hypothetical protein